jgi:hypothetical protein
MPDNGASVDWFWGVDVSTFQLSMGVWGAHGGLTWRTETIRTKSGPGQLDFPAFLPAAHDAAMRLIGAAHPNMPPTVVSIEMPVGPHVKPTLTATWGVTVEVFAATLPAVVVWTPKTPEWRKTFGIENKTPKAELVTIAQGVGYTGEDDNEAEACLIAIAASLSYARR